MPECTGDSVFLPGAGRRMAMSYVVAAPEFLASAASDLSGIGSSLSAGHAVAAVPTTAVVAAAGDEVSAAVASLFSGHVQALNAGAGAYASTEAASAGPLQTLAQGLPVPNMAVSVGGFTLLRSGSATASSEPLTWGHRDRLRRQWHREGHRFF